ncbi:hypothetical protein BGX38DRAFT_470852 [Terfezia claveryi]|nr:hypothetical protein BGX38DRAFT_470852 [Terfezia claveryi]
MIEPPRKPIQWLKILCLLSIGYSRSVVLGHQRTSISSPFSKYMYTVCELGVNLIYLSTLTPFYNITITTLSHGLSVHFPSLSKNSSLTQLTSTDIDIDEIARSLQPSKSYSPQSTFSDMIFFPYSPTWRSANQTTSRHGRVPALKPVK